MNNNLNNLLNDLKKCNICREKFGFEPHPVIFGNEKSKIVQISQAPSRSVHETHKPFTDKSGDKLKYEWYQITDEEFYDENNFYITSLAHCYPGKNNKSIDRLPPKICLNKWVMEELKYIDNEIYILIGAKSAGAFFPGEEFDKLVFKDNILNGKKTFVLPHPSPLNIKWFKDHPEFMEKRIYEIRKEVQKVLTKK